MAHSRIGLPAILIAACACSSAQKPYNPFKVARESFYPGLKVVALAPVRVPGDLPDPEPVRELFASSITAKLKAAGLAVVPASETGPIIEAKRKEVGGVFDPTTGKLDEAKARVLSGVIGRELKARFNADALLTPTIGVVNAALVHDQARWDGVTEQAGKGGFWKAFVATHSGYIRALSLVVFLADPEGQLLYVKGGGIQVLGNVTAGGEVERRSRNELFADGERNENAVHIALDALLAGNEKM